MPRIPLRWLAEHVDLPAGTTAEALAADLVRVGLEEEAIHPASVTGPLVVGRVVERTPEPQKNGKTISWCRVEVGAHGEAREDGTLGPRGIVCGAHNFDVGDSVVVALPGAVLPGPFPIASRKTYGHVSDGMICSARELGIGEDHDGIIVLARMGLEAEPGTDARELLGLGEDVLEINVTPDRGYCFSMRGVAREYSHATGARFTDRGLGAAADLSGHRPGFPVELDDARPIHGVAGCDRFVARVVRGVAASGPSPVWMQRRLTQAGMRPISLAVDVTNLVMLDLGQPLHAYDLSQVAAPVVVRRAEPGDRLTTLDGVQRVLHPEDLLITDSPGSRGARVLGLAGVMGGADSEVSSSTTDLLIEGAHFDPVSVARTARRHKLVSEAARRFERGVDPLLARVAVDRVVALLLEHGGGRADDEVTDVDRTPPRTVVRLPLDLPARLVGVDYTPAQVRETLEAIGCTLEDVPTEPAAADVTVPSWRPDLAVPVDLVEEVARLRGYADIPSVLPPAPAGRGLTRGQRVRRSVARALADAGLVETLSYPFVGPHQLDELGLPADDDRRRALRLVNPLSEQQPDLRTDLLVTVLDTARRNVARGASDVALFEIGLVTRPGDAPASAPQLPGGARPADEELARLDAAVPDQPRHVAGVLSGLREAAGWWGPGRPVEHTDAIAAALLVARVVGVEVTLVPDADHAPWHPGRTARLEGPDGAILGHAGELHPNVVAALGLPPRAAAFEVDLDGLLAGSPDEPVQARPISTFPVAKEDIALVVDSDVAAGDLLQVVCAGARGSSAGDVLEELRLFDVYTGSQVGPGKKSVAFSLRLRADDRTLTSQEAAAVRESAVQAAHTRFGAVLRG